MAIIPELEGTTPWWLYAAIDQIGDAIQPDWEMFEWGSGGSTLWFAQRARFVTSYEHDLAWCNKTMGELAQYGLSNAIVEYQPNLDVYAEAILDYAEPFDLISVDGRNRAGCLCCAVGMVKPGGYLVLDNSEREQYQDAMRLYDGWQRWDYAKVPDQAGYAEWCATVWRRPE